MLMEIGKTNEVYALRLLQCLTVAMRPFYVEELAEILALDFRAEEGLPELKENWRSNNQQDAVLSMCSSLIVIIPGDRDVVQFSHFSVKEFLTSERLATSSIDISHLRVLPEPAHTLVAKACLGILLLSEDAEVNIEERYPLFRYAAAYWVEHARFKKVWTRVEDGIRRLFDPAKLHFKLWFPHSRLQSSQFFMSPTKLYKPCGSSLYYASLCGFFDLAKQLISENPQHATDQVGLNPTPLAAALSCGHLDIAELLYEAGADLELRTQDNTTLLHAVSAVGLLGAANWLFNHGVLSANSPQDNREPPLHLAGMNSHISVNAVDNNNQTPLHLASQDGHYDMVRELLLRGADVSVQDRSYRTPLHLVFPASFEAYYP